MKKLSYFSVLVLALTLSLSGSWRLSAHSSGVSTVVLSSDSIPQWILDNWAQRTRGSGAWITDNSAYQSEQEPYEAYGLRWSYGLGNQSFRGSLYLIQDGKEAGTVWEFLEFWDPAAGEVRILQLGADGTVGQGRIWQSEEEEGILKEQQLFTRPDGVSFTTGHGAWMEDGQHHTRSYRIVDGEWVEQRYYIWQLQR